MLARVLVICALLVVAALPLRGQRGPVPDPLIREGVTVKLGPHPYAIPDGGVPLVPNVGIVVGARATHVVDLHAGDGNESLRPYVYWITTGGATVAEMGRKMALASGFDHIVVDRGRPTDPAASVYLSNTAILRGKPALTVESGFLATSDEPSIARIEQAVAGWLKLLGMRSAGPDPVASPVWLERSEVLTSRHTGIWYPTVERGQTVAEGTIIGRVTDFFGKTLQEVRAPFAGEVLYVVGTPAMNEGEPVGFIGSPVK